MCTSSRHQLRLFEADEPKFIIRIHEGDTVEYTTEAGTKSIGVVVYFNDQVAELEYFDGDDLQAIDVGRTAIVAIVSR